MNRFVVRMPDCGMLRRFAGRVVAGTPFEQPARSTYRRLTGRPSDPVALRNGEYDALTKQVIRRVLKSDSNTVDAGAHRGVFTEECLRRAPRGRHHAFEPVPVLAAEIRRRLPDAIVHEMALADSRTRTTLHYLPDKPAESSLFSRPDRERGLQVIDVEVEVAPLDDVLPQELAISFMKVDVEDAERALFRGAFRTLDRWKPTVVFECHVDHLREVADLLSKPGLEVQLLDDLLDGRRRSGTDLHARAVDEGHWYFAAIPR